MTFLKNYSHVVNNFLTFVLDNSGRGVGASPIVRVRTTCYVNIKVL